MEANDLYKIGITNNLKKRYKTFKTANPDIQIITHSKKISFAQELAQKLHMLLEEKRVSGEWFQLDVDDVALVIKLLLNLNEACKQRLDEVFK